MPAHLLYKPYEGRSANPALPGDKSVPVQRSRTTARHGFFPYRTAGHGGYYSDPGHYVLGIRFAKPKTSATAELPEEFANDLHSVANLRQRTRREVPGLTVRENVQSTTGF